MSTKLFKSIFFVFGIVSIVVGGVVSGVVSDVVGGVVGEILFFLGYGVITCGFFSSVAVSIIVSGGPFVKDNKTPYRNETITNIMQDNTKIINDIRESFKDILDEQNNQYDDLKHKLDELSKTKKQNDILALMHENMGEIKDYFSISKRHAEMSFKLAVISCVVGLLLLCVSVLFALTNPNIEPAILAAVAGATAELFAATTLVVHKKSLTQFNHFYDSLHENEILLLTTHLVGNLNIDRQDDVYIEIIKNEMAVRQAKITSAKS